MYWENDSASHDRRGEGSCPRKTQRAAEEVTGKIQPYRTKRESDKKVSRVAKGEETGQPAAADMRELVWDDELEQIAQR